MILNHMKYDAVYDTGFTENANILVHTGDSEVSNVSLVISSLYKSIGDKWKSDGSKLLNSSIGCIIDHIALGEPKHKSGNRNDVIKFNDGYISIKKVPLVILQKILKNLNLKIFCFIFFLKTPPILCKYMV